MNLPRLHASLLRATPAWHASSPLLPFRLASHLRQLNRSFHSVPFCAKSPAAGLRIAGRNPLNGARRSFGSDARSSFPPVSSKAVAYWLLGSAASVFGIVVFGGLTRLTESGYVPSNTLLPARG
jgi:hypothetical protein